tara:strand:- start:13279 stop:13995 length:717 start_codon:yes stop_codon:yes gene_type:complete
LSAQIKSALTKVTEKRHFPIYLNLEGKQCIVIGGGDTAFSKIESLLNTGAEIIVVAPEANSRIQSLAMESKVLWIRKGFEATDANDAFLVVSTLEDQQENQEIFDLLNSLNKLVNVHDDAPRCNFIYPAVAKSGPIQVAVSTEGKSPAMAQRIRNRIKKEILTDGIGNLVDFIGSRRNIVQNSITSFQKRVQFWRELLDSNFPKVLTTNKFKASQQFDSHLSKYRNHKSPDAPSKTKF